MIKKIDKSWNPIKHLLNKKPLSILFEKVLPNISYQPKRNDIFNAFQMPLSEIKVVILDTHPNPIKGDIGYAYREDLRYTSTFLRQIYEEIKQSDRDRINFSGEPDIKSWAAQGVLLLHASLTTETAQDNNHEEYWREFTKHIIKFISKNQPCIWVFWGNVVRLKSNIPLNNSFLVDKYNRDLIKEIPILDDTNYILSGPHPVTNIFKVDRQFKNCDHFYKINEILKKQNKKQILW